MQTVLVTGAGGYIGSITTKSLLEAGYKVIATDSFVRGYREPLEKLQTQYGANRLTIRICDIREDGAKDIFDEFPDISGVLHFAALLNVGESFKEPVAYFDTNVMGTQKLLETMIKNEVKYFVFSSSCTVYGDAQYLPIDEQHPLAKPASPYGATKKINEEILEWYGKLGKLHYVALRYFNVCGATDDGEYGDSKRPSFHLMQNAVRGALGLAKFELNYATVNTPDGSPIRDYLHVVDLAEAHVKALEYSMREQKSEIFNLGTGSGYSVLEIINKVKEITGKDFAIGETERRAGEADKMVADNKKAKELLGWEPKHTLEQSVKSLVDWYTKYPGGWKE